jgi:O-antigen/teichoic acid export membrane protein
MTIKKKLLDSNNNKRIAKNTLLLYFRMLLTMGVSLYTVRIVLGTLGAIDYGIYNVVGGIVVAFAFFTGTMATASQRFFSYEIGRGNMVQLKRTFSMTMLIYCLMAAIILLLAETVGLWFLNHKISIPANRMAAANWVFQFSVFTFMLSMFQISYDAIVIAREKMNVYAYLSILDVVMKLVIVYLLLILPYDKLKSYGVLTFFSTLIITSIYRIYCIRNFRESKFEYYWDKRMFKEITLYSGWNMFGALAGMFNNQGINIVLNLFFGPTVNAARGVAYQINTAISGFVQNFMTAARPQIIKYYAQGEKEKMLQLVFQSSKYSFFLLYIITLPLLLQTEYLLNLWLHELPDYVVSFARIIVITTLFESLSYPLMAAAQATGNVKKYQVIVGGCLLLNLPAAYLFVRFGYPPESTLIVMLVTTIICLFLRLVLLRQMVSLSIRSFVYSVLLPVTLVSVLAFILPFGVYYFGIEYGFMQFLLVCVTSIISGLLSIYVIGLKKNEKMKLKNWMSQFLKRIKK